MAQFGTFDLGQIYAQGEAIKGARQMQQLRGQDAQWQQQDRQAAADMEERKRALAKVEWVLQSPSPAAALKGDPDAVREFSAQGIDVSRLDDRQAAELLMAARAKMAADMGMGPPPAEKPQYREVAPGGTVLQMGPQGATPVYQAPDRPEKPKGPSDAPSGYRWGPSGNLEPIPGGPSDPAGPGARRNTQPLRKEFRALPSVRDYETALPIMKSASKAPDNGYGYLQLIYTVGKLLDPNSVVREGELALTIAAGSPLQRIIGSTRFTVEKGGRLTPQSRQQIMEMLTERIGAYKLAYDKDYQQYAEYAKEQGVDPSMVVGKHAESAYTPAAGSGPKPGQVVKGYRFKGGDPANQSSWVKVK